jgi:hypothetical protein
MKVVDRLEPLFYGAGITGTHLVSETKFEWIEGWNNMPNIKRFKTECGKDISINWKRRENDYTKDEALKVIDCKICLKRLKELENEN